MMISSDDLISFEREIGVLWEAGDIPSLLHLSGGNEAQLIKIFAGKMWDGIPAIKQSDWVFSTHRNHYHYLLKGGSRDKLKSLILDCRSMFVYDKELRFFTSSVLAGTCAIACGVALAGLKSGNKVRTWVFLGDGAEDEGHFYEAVRHVDATGLPVTFIIEDNNRSVDCDKIIRGSRTVISSDCVRRYSYKPTYPHAGNGTAKHIDFKVKL